MTEFVNDIEFLQYKAPKDLPDANSKYINSAEQTNVCITQQIRNAMTLSGVELPNTVTRSDAIDPLFLAKTIQHYASFAQSYIVDPSSTANNIIITPSTQNIQLQTVSLESNGSEIVVNTNNINGLVDAQVFDKLPNGAIFQFMPSLSNTSSTINLTVRIKRLKWDVGELSQIIETKDFLYQIKDIDGITSLNSSDIRSAKLIIVHFDSSKNVFKLVNKQIQQASQTVAGISYLNKPILLTYSSETIASYSSGTFDFDDGSGSVYVSSGGINLANVGLNGMDTGSIPTSGWLYTYAIYNPTTGVSGCIASLSTTSPTLPSGFTKKKRIKNGFLRIASSAIQQFSHYENDWISTNKIVVANQQNVINYTSSALPVVALKADLTSYISLTQTGQSTQVVWGNLKPWTSDVDGLFLVTNNVFTNATNGYIYASDGVIRATNPTITGGVGNSQIILKAISEL